MMTRWSVKYLASLCWGVLGLTACDSLPAENQALKKRVVQAISSIESRPVGDTLMLDMSVVANFPWDTLYMFTGTSTVGFISEGIGVEWPGTENVHEDDNLLVFMHQGRIADYVYFRGFNFQQEPYFVKFIGHFDTGELFTPTTAHFAVVRDRKTPQMIELIDPFQRKSIYRPHYDPSKVPF